MAPANRYNPGLHRLALLTAAATFPLIFMGGLVTSHGAGLAVPDWPNSYGYNMFTFPPSQWIGGIFYEHTHRLMGSVVGLLAIALLVWAWVTEGRSRVSWLATAVLVAVILQGVIGGLRVVLVKLDLAIVHACIAQAFFCLAALTALVTSRWWNSGPDLSQSADASRGRQLIRIAALAVIVVYGQLIVGALMRHYNAGLAIPDLPLAYGKVIPSTDDKALRVINWNRVMQHLPPVTAGQIWLHLAHRVGSLIVTVAITMLVTRIIQRHRRDSALLRPAVLLIILLVAQITLGVFTVLTRKSADIASAHVAVGALILMTCFVLTARAVRLYRPRGALPATSRRGFAVRPADTTTGGEWVPA